MSQILSVAGGDCKQVVGRRWFTWRHYYNRG